jgi:hypothetical protein
MAVHRGQNMKREDQQDATIRCLLLTSGATCFGHHYAHLQENKGPVTAFVVFWFCWMWLVAVDGRCLEGCEHYSAHILQDNARQPEQHNKCSNRAFVLLKMGIMMPETC